MKRKTSIYVLFVPAHVPANQLADAMRDTATRLGAQVAGSWTRLQGTQAVLLFRTASDADAIRIAENCGGDTIGAKLTTGIGVNERTVAVA